MRIARDVDAHTCDDPILGLVLAIDDAQHMHGGVGIDTEELPGLGVDALSQARISPMSRRPRNACVTRLGVR